MRILIVEDQPRSAQFIGRGLEEDGHTVEVVGDVEAATSRLGRDPQPDLVVLDLMLATGDGLAVLETLRESAGTPVLALSARDSVADKVAALDLGADDYLVKPFAFKEFLARVRALSRRGAVPLDDGTVPRSNASEGSERRAPEVWGP